MSQCARARDGSEAGSLPPTLSSREASTQPKEPLSGPSASSLCLPRPALGAGEGTAPSRTGWHQAGSQLWPPPLWPVYPNLFPPRKPQKQQRKLMSYSQDPSFPQQGKGGEGIVSCQGYPTHTFDTFDRTLATVRTNLS